MIPLLQSLRSRWLRKDEFSGFDGPRRFPESAEVREGRPRIGVALSSGGAKGLAHIGVIQVLEKNGIPIDGIAGASMGAYVGSLWAAGYSGVQLEELAAEMKDRKELLRLVDPAFPPRQGLLRGLKVKRHLQRSLGERQFSDLERELFVVATNLVTLERKVFTEGEVAAAVHASAAIPGVCVPVEIDGQYYSDGGICDPLPVDVLRNAGYDYVIGVSTLPSPEDLVACRIDYFREDPPSNVLHRMGRFINRELNFFARGNMIDILRSSAFGSQTRLADEAGKRADVLIRAAYCEGRWHDYSGFEKYIALGRQVAEAKIEEIKELIFRKAA